MRDSIYLEEMFINEAKPALVRHSGGGGASQEELDEMYKGFIEGTLETLVIPNGVTTIKDGDVDGFPSLKNLVIPETVTTVESWSISPLAGMVLTFKGTPTSIDTVTFGYSSTVFTINVPWSKGAVSGAPWGASKATINYDYVGE